MREGVKIAYICDGLDKCSDKVGCYRHAKTLLDICTHTTDPKHAVNGAVDDPALYPERFCKLGNDESNIRYWEGDFNIPYENSHQRGRTIDVDKFLELCMDYAVTPSDYEFCKRLEYALTKAPIIPADPKEEEMK